MSFAAFVCVGDSGRPRRDWGLRERREALRGRGRRPSAEAGTGKAPAGAGRLGARVHKELVLVYFLFLRAPFYFCFLKVCL